MIMVECKDPIQSCHLPLSSMLCASTVQDAGTRVQLATSSTQLKESLKSQQLHALKHHDLKYYALKHRNKRCAGSDKNAIGKILVKIYTQRQIPNLTSLNLTKLVSFRLKTAEMLRLVNVTNPTNLKRISCVNIPLPTVSVFVTVPVARSTRLKKNFVSFRQHNALVFETAHVEKLTKLKISVHTLPQSAPEYYKVRVLNNTKSRRLQRTLLLVWRKLSQS